jgi:hypothetical protein
MQEYFTLRRSLGFKLRDAARVLSKFVAFMEEPQAPHITTKFALEWVQLAETVQPAERARRLRLIRGFARHRRATDSLTELPARELYPYRSTRARPYLYGEREVKAGGRAATSDEVAIDTVATVGISLLSGFTQRHGHALLRSARSEARECRSRSGRAHETKLCDDLNYL